MKKLLILLLCLLMVGSFAMAENSFQGEFKIGIVLPRTGNYAEHGKGQEVAYTMAIEKVNANGGVNGKKLVAEIQDSGGDATQSVEILRKYIEDEEIMMVFGDYSSTEALAMAPIAQENKIPMLSPSSSSAKVPLTGDYCFTMVGVQQDEQAIVVQYAMEKYFGGKKGGIVYVDNSWGQTIYEAQLLAYENTKGMELVSALPVDAETTDFSSIVTQLRADGVDTLFLGLQVDQCAAAVNYMDSNGFADECNIVISGACYTDNFIKLTGDSTEGMIITQPFFVSEDNAVLYDWTQDYKARSNLNPSLMTADAYDAILMCSEYISKFNASTREEVRDAVAQIANWNGGVTGEITMDNIGTVHRLQYIMGIENGAFVMIHDTSYVKDYKPFMFEYAN